jgi:hypothetical protein
MTAGQAEERLREIAPPPGQGTEVTARDLARYLAVRAQLGFTRNVTPFIREGQEVPAALVLAQFAAACALLVLGQADDEAAGVAARQITGAWADGNTLGACLHDYVTGLGIDVAELGRLDEARLGLEDGGRGGREADAERLEAAVAVLERRYPGTRPEPLDDVLDELRAIARAWRRKAAGA